MLFDLTEVDQKYKAVDEQGLDMLDVVSVDTNNLEYTTFIEISDTGRKVITHKARKIERNPFEFKLTIYPADDEDE